MTPPKGDGERILRVEADLVELRERLTRVETSMVAHEAAAAERHRELLAAVRELRARTEAAEQKAWKLALVLLGVGVGGGAGAAEWVRMLWVVP